MSEHITLVRESSSQILTLNSWINFMVTNSLNYENWTCGNDSLLKPNNSFLKHDSLLIHMHVIRVEGLSLYNLSWTCLDTLLRLAGWMKNWRNVHTCACMAQSQAWHFIVMYEFVWPMSYEFITWNELIGTNIPLFKMRHPWQLSSCPDPAFWIWNHCLCQPDSHIFLVCRTTCWSSVANKWNIAQKVANIVKSIKIFWNCIC